MCGGDYNRSNGRRGHAHGNNIIEAAFPPPDEWGDACHSGKIWVVRVIGTTVILGVILPLVIGIAGGIVLPGAILYYSGVGIGALWQKAKRALARRKRRQHARTADQSNLEIQFRAMAMEERRSHAVGAHVSQDDICNHYFTDGTVRVFRQNFTLEDHAIRRGNQWHSSRVSTFLTSVTL
jgi:hypothetical protein